YGRVCAPVARPVRQQPDAGVYQCGYECDLEGPEYPHAGHRVTGEGEEQFLQIYVKIAVQHLRVSRGVQRRLNVPKFIPRQRPPAMHGQVHPEAEEKTHDGAALDEEPLRVLTGSRPLAGGMSRGKKQAGPRSPSGTSRRRSLLRVRLLCLIKSLEFVCHSFPLIPRFTHNARRTTYSVRTRRLTHERALT